MVDITVPATPAPPSPHSPVDKYLYAAPNIASWPGSAPHWLVTCEEKLTFPPGYGWLPHTPTLPLYLWLVDGYVPVEALVGQLMDSQQPFIAALFIVGIDTGYHMY